MSAIRSFSRLPRATVFATQRMDFQSSALRLASKESALNQDGRADEAEHHKQDLLKKHKEGKGHWKDELASDSESIIKADRGEMDASEETIKQLQQETERLNKNKK